ncbi:MAG: aminotransferase class V-fold PLP-dependent enzyme [Gemmatimonadaceae bacterium]|nr:aminotransferase class V-fold PLP-dependent enzyme [Gemmatimonadaceae bacterium]
MTSRRSFMKDAALLGAASLAAGTPALATTAADTAPNGTAPNGTQPPLKPPAGTPQQVARNEVFWQQVAARYHVKSGLNNMEAGFFGMMARPVLEAYHRNIDRANRDSSFFARREFPALQQQARVRVAEFIGAKPTEIAFSRNATEALQGLIGQYNKIRSGDTIMYADLDYNAMQYAMNALAERTGAKLVTFDIPEPASRDAILAAYTKALDANPKTKLLLLTHCNNKTGLLLPVKDIVAIARPRGIDVVVDAAHSFGQVSLTMADLDADFVGLNLHKWIGAPVGAGVMYIREDKLASIDRAHGDVGPLEGIDSRMHTGTSNFATILTIPDALDFQATIGVANKAARLRYLRDRWVGAVRTVSGVDILTPDDPELVGAITGFRLHGRGTREANQAITKALLDEFGIFTFYRTGLAKGDCVRVTPALYNSVADADALASAIKTVALRG